MSRESTNTLAALKGIMATRRHLPAPAGRRAIRLGAGVSVVALATALGVSRQSVHAWEAGTRTPRDANLAKYVEALKLLREMA